MRRNGLKKWIRKNQLLLKFLTNLYFFIEASGNKYKNCKIVKKKCPGNRSQWTGINCFEWTEKLKKKKKIEKIQEKVQKAFKKVPF